MDIHWIYVKKVKARLVVENVKFYFEKRVTKFGNSAKIDCPKKYVGRKAVVVVEG